MLRNELERGNIDNIIAMLKGVEFEVKNNFDYPGHCRLVIGEAPDKDAAYEGLDEDRAEARKVGNWKMADDLLCAAQSRAYSAGWRPLSLGCNIHGWAVNDRLGSNLSGGRAAINPNGHSQEEAIRWALAKVESGRNVTLDIFIRDLHARVLDALGLEQDPETGRWTR